MKRNNPYSLSHVDTCLPCYLQDHHNRDGELLLCAMVDGSTRWSHVIDQLRSELQSSDRDIDWDLAKLAIYQYAKSVDRRRLFDSSLERNGEDCDESCYAYFVLSFPES